MRGFTLVETLVALALLTLALLLGLGLVLQHPRVVRRLDAQREANHFLESSLEALRAGGLPLASQTLPPAGQRKIPLFIQVDPVSNPPGLYRVKVYTAYQVGGHPKERSVETLLWRPPEP